MLYTALLVVHIALAVDFNLNYLCESDVLFLPISGLMGANMKTKVDKSICPWWDGPCLFEALDAIEVPLRDPKGPFRYFRIFVLLNCFATRLTRWWIIPHD